MSATHSRFGAAAVNCRLTKSAGRWSAVSVMVVNTGLPRCTPRNPALRIKRRVCSRPTTQPRRVNGLMHLLDPVHREVLAVHGAQVGDQLFVANLAVGCRPAPGCPVAAGGEEPPGLLLARCGR